MKLILIPLIGGSGVGVTGMKNYVTPNTQLCIWDRAFPSRDFIQLPEKGKSFKIGPFAPRKYKGKVFLRKLSENKKHYDEYRVLTDGCGNAPSWLYAKELLDIPFANQSEQMNEPFLEELIAFEMLHILPPETKVLTLLFL